MKEKSKEQKKAVIYVRVSSAGAVEKRQNCDRQIADLTSYAEYANLNVCKSFEEHISGAKKVSDREVLVECLNYCKTNKIDFLLCNELSRLGRNAFEVLSTIKDLADNGINLYLQKEKFTLLDENGKPSTFAPIMLATLSTCAEIERENILFRLQSGRKNAIESGTCKLGRKVGSVKTKDQKRIEYANELVYLKKGYSVKDIAKLTGKGISTIARLKKDFFEELYA